MGQKGTTYASDLLKLIFQNIALPLVGDAAGVQPSAAAGNLYLSLHTADPGAGGDQDTNEAAYTGYARAPVERSALGWVVTGTFVSPASLIAFPPGTGGGELCTFAAVGTDASGPGKLLYRGALTPNVTTGDGITPEIPATSTIAEL